MIEVDNYPSGLVVDAKGNVRYELFGVMVDLTPAESQAFESRGRQIAALFGTMPNPGEFQKDERRPEQVLVPGKGKR